MYSSTKKKLLIILLCVACAIPAYAVFNEKNISKTISVLRHELHLTLQEIKDQDRRHEKASKMDEVQHKDLVNTVRWINEMTLILYSQDNGFTLDQTCAMDYVIYEYNRFFKRRRPQFANIGAIDTEIERYQRLIEALRVLPPKLDAIEEVPDTLRQEAGEFDIEIESINFLLDSILTDLGSSSIAAERIKDSTALEKEEISLLKELATYGRNARKEAATKGEDDIFILPADAQADRDSCIAYAKAIVQSYTRQKEKLEEDYYYYTEMHKRLQTTYEYAKQRFEEIQNYIFVTGQENYFHVLANLRKYASDTASEMEQKYGSGDTPQDRVGLRESQWRGIVLASTVLYSFFHLLLIALIVILLSCVFLKNVKPFNTEWFKQTKPVAILLAISAIYSLLLMISMLFPMSNFMSVAGMLAMVYFWFIIALLLSIIIGFKPEDVRQGLKVFAPVMVLGLIVVFYRAIFLPDKMIHLLSTPLLLVFLVWQIHVTIKYKFKSDDYRNINRLQIITAVVCGLGLISALEGYSLFALMFIMWWIFQVATLATLASIAYIMQFYEKKGLAKKKGEYAITHKMVSQNEDGDFIHVTWLYDFIYRALIPIIGIMSILGCIWLAAGVFNLSETCRVIFHKPFFDFTNADGNPILQVSLFKLASVSALFFLFRYLNYLTRSLYRINKFEKVMQNSGNEFVRKNDVNLTLAYNVIGIIIWGLFIFYAIYILKIPVGAISIVAAGLATGIGLALKDVLNNFIYGIQLMSGRLRVGDMVECDGIRGTVEKISYQSTEIQTLAGAVISFTNSTLFNKNFQNLTKNSPYEFLSVIVSISYGEDVEKVRGLILEALKDYTKKKDKYGRLLIERKGGIWISFDEFCDSSVNLAIKQRVLVESKNSYAAEVRELVYKLFNENGIVIPFPQQEVSILNLPQK